MLAPLFVLGDAAFLLGILLLSGASAAALWQVGNLNDSHWINWAFSLVLLATFGVLGVILRHGGRFSLGGRGALDPREAEAQRLRAARERARAIFEMATTLSSTLEHQRVLEEAQKIGTLALSDDLSPARATD